MVESIVDGRVVLGLIAIPGVLWAASGFVARLRHALGVVFRTRWTGLISGRFRGMVVSIPLLAGLLVVLALPGSVSGLVGSGVVDVLVEVLTYLAVLVGGIAFFLAVFRFLTPQSPLSWRDHLPGAVMATVGWLLLQWVGAVRGSRRRAQLGLVRSPRRGLRAARLPLRGRLRPPALGRALAGAMGAAEGGRSWQTTR